MKKIIYKNISAKYIANIFLYFARNCQIVMTEMKLQKLVFRTYGLYASVTHHKLFTDDIRMCFDTPVIGGLYYDMLQFNRKELPRDFNFINTAKTPCRFKAQSIYDAHSVIGLTWQRYKDIDCSNRQGTFYEEDCCWNIDGFAKLDFGRIERFFSKELYSQDFCI